MPGHLNFTKERVKNRKSHLLQMAPLGNNSQRSPMLTPFIDIATIPPRHPLQSPLLAGAHVRGLSDIREIF
jgi:hypothetical protein